MKLSRSLLCEILLSFFLSSSRLLGAGEVKVCCLMRSLFRFVDWALRRLGRWGRDEIWWDKVAGSCKGGFGIGNWVFGWLFYTGIQLLRRHMIIY